MPWRYVNEARIDEGREPIKALEGKIIMATPVGAVDISDVPTVREVLEMQAAKRQAPPPSGKDATTQALEAMAEAMGVKDQVFVDAIAKAVGEPRPVTMLSDYREKRTSSPRDRVVARETQFITDGTGRITGKTETEVVTDDAEAEAQEAEVKRLATELRIAEEAAAARQTRQVKRVTEFVTDEHGKVTGKIEREITDGD